jgi:hypothetical protein
MVINDEHTLLLGEIKGKLEMLDNNMQRRGVAAAIVEREGVSRATATRIVNAALNRRGFACIFRKNCFEYCTGTRDRAAGRYPRRAG